MELWDVSGKETVLEGEEEEGEKEDSCLLLLSLRVDEDVFVMRPRTLIVTSPTPNITTYFCFSSSLSKDAFNFSTVALTPVLVLRVKATRDWLFSATLVEMLPKISWAFSAFMAHRTLLQPN